METTKVLYNTRKYYHHPLDIYMMKQRYSKIVDYLLFFIIALSIPFLFFDGPIPLNFRLLPYLWNYGHIVLFAAIFWLIFSKWDFFTEKSIYWVLLTTLLPTILVSIPIEWVQSMDGREFSLLDIIRNYLGVTVAIAFHPHCVSSEYF